MDIELLGGIPSSFEAPEGREEEKREIAKISVKANKFFKEVMNQYPGDPVIENWALESHQNLRQSLCERFMGVSSSVPDDLGKSRVNVDHSE